MYQKKKKIASCNISSGEPRQEKHFLSEHKYCLREWTPTTQMMTSRTCDHHSSFRNKLSVKELELNMGQQQQLKYTSFCSEIM